MKKPKRLPSGQYQEYFNFFLQLPAADYLDDIKTQDEWEVPSDLSVHGLSDEQVSQIALDSIRDARRLHKQQPNDSRLNPPQNAD